MLKRLWSLIAVSVVAATVSQAVPVTFQYNSINNTVAGATLNAAPIVGSGNLTFDASRNLLSGSLSLPTYSTRIQIPGFFDVTVVTTGWQQTLVAATNSGGNITLAGGSAAGSNSCDGTGAAALACGGATPVVSPVLPFGVGGAAGVQTVVMTLSHFDSPTNFAGTITSTTVGTQSGTTTAVFTFASAVPEPGTVLLLGAGLFGLGLIGRRRA